MAEKGCDFSTIAGYADAVSEVQAWYEENGCELVELTKKIGESIEEYNSLAKGYNNQFAKYAPLLQKFSNSGWTPSTLDVLLEIENITYDEVNFELTIQNMLTLAPKWTDEDTGEGIGTARFGSREGGTLQASHPILMANELSYDMLQSWTKSQYGTRVQEGQTYAFLGVGSDYNSPTPTETERSEAEQMCENLWLYMSPTLAVGDAILDGAFKLFLMWEELEHVVTRVQGAAVTEGGFFENLLKTADEQRADALARAKAAEEAQELRKLGNAIEWKSYEKLLFKEQCFLLAKIFDVVQHKSIMEWTTPQTKKLPYYTQPGQPGSRAPTNACLQVEGEPFGFMNLLTQNPAQSAFFDMETKEIASLQPMIRLFKVKEADIVDEMRYNEGMGREEVVEGKEFQHEIMFDAYASTPDVESIFSNKAKRGFGAGIKKFSFTYDGNNPFAAKKSIKAKLQIFANSFSELLVDRGGYRYIDLALKTGGGTKIEACEEASGATQSAEAQENLAKLNFRLKAVVGWARPSGDNSLFTTTSGAQLTSVLQAIDESYATLNLTPTIHEFEIDEMGRVNFTINYLAYIDDFFDQAHFNIFYDRQSGGAILQRRLLYKSMEAECDSAPEKISEFKEAQAKSGAIREEKINAMRSLMRRMRENNRIKYITLSYDELRGFESQGPWFETSNDIVVKDSSNTLGSVSKELQEEYVDKYIDSRRVGVDPLDKQYEAELNRQKEMIRIALEAHSPDANHIAFFYISDLIDTILEGLDGYLQSYSTGGEGWENIKDIDIDDCLREKEAQSITRFYENFKKFRVLLGPLEIVDPKNPANARFISLGDVPLSVKYFMEWLSKKTTQKNQTVYSLSKFLNDVFNELIRNFLNDDSCFTFNTKQKIRLNQAVVTSYKNKKSEEDEQTYDEITDFILAEAEFFRKEGIIDDNQYPSRAQIYPPFEKGPLLNISGPSNLPVPEGGLENETNYLVFSAGRLRPKGRMTGNRKGHYVIDNDGETPKEVFQLGDEDVGIFHYIAGRPRGIVKKISLSKTDSPYLKEVRFEQEGYDGLEQLREVYDIQVDCFANVKTFPGTYIFVDPRGFAPNTTAYTSETGVEEINDLTKYGIGGYCMIIRSEHTFGAGEANTTLTTKWVSEIDKALDEGEQTATNSTGAGANTPSKCKSILKRKGVQTSNTNP